MYRNSSNENKLLNSNNWRAESRQEIFRLFFKVENEWEIQTVWSGDTGQRYGIEERSVSTEIQASVQLDFRLIWALGSDLIKVIPIEGILHYSVGCVISEWLIYFSPTSIDIDKLYFRNFFNKSFQNDSHEHMVWLEGFCTLSCNQMTWDPWFLVSVVGKFACGIYVNWCRKPHFLNMFQK